MSSEPRRYVVTHDPPSKAFTKWLISTIGVLHLAVAYGVHMTGDIDYKWVSTVIFIVAGVACFGVVLKLESIWLVAFTGALTMTSYSSRIGLVLISSSRGHTDLADGRVIIAISGYTLMAVYAYAVFLRGVAPLSRMYRKRG